MLQEEYLKQYMAQVNAIQQRKAAERAGQLSPQGQQELKHLKHELAAAEGTVCCAVLCCAVLSCAVLCCAVLCCAVQKTYILQCSAWQ